MATIDPELFQFKTFQTPHGFESVLIVMALQEESQGLLERAGFKPLYVGMGLLNSSLALQKYLLQTHQKIDRVLNIGTAGTHDPSLLHQIVEVRQALYRGSTVSVLNKNINLQTHTGNPSVICGSADFVETVESRLSRTPSENTKYDIMDMECYAIASVCESFSVPLTAIKYVTDLSNASTYQDWKKQLVPAAKALSKVLTEL